MSVRYYANAPATTLAASCTNVDTTIQVASVAGLPIQYPYTLILDREQATEEAVSVTNAAGTTLTVTRGIDGTTAFSHSLGAEVVHGITAQDIREANTHVNSSSGVHGVTGALVGATDAQTLTNKTLGNTNVINGFTASRLAEMDGTGRLVSGSKSIPSGAVVGTTDAQALTNKTVDLASNTLTGTKAQFNTALSDGDFATQAGAETLTNKTIALGSNTVSGTTAQFNAANTDGDFATLAGTETLSNKTLASPVITGVGSTLWVNKSVNEARTSTTTMANDAELSFPVVANGTYVVDIMFRYAAWSTSNGGIDCQWSLPSGSVVGHARVFDNSATELENAYILNGSGDFGAARGAGVAAPEYIFGTQQFLIGATGGTVNLQWCQMFSNANATTMWANSFMIVRRVA